MNRNKELGGAIKELRLSKLMSQRQIADKIGISANKYSLIEDDVCLPTLEILKKLAEIFNITVNDLTKNIHQTNYINCNCGKPSQQITDMIDLFYANKSLYKKLIRRYK
jgi:toxin-antitoxin system, antitoxin component, xre family